MKKSEIKIGHIYSNGKSSLVGEQREIIDEWYTYCGKKTEYVKYRILYTNGIVGERELFTFTILKKSFAKWAKEDVT